MKSNNNTVSSNFNQEVKNIDTLTNLNKAVIIESLDTASDHIDDTYFDELMQLPLHDQSKKQLENIKNMLIAHGKSTIQKDRLTIQNGCVMIDGFWLPIQYHSDDKNMNMADNISVYSDAMITWLNFIAESTGRIFDRWKVNKESLIDGKLWYYDICRQLNNSNNRSILISLSKIISRDGYIVIGKDQVGGSPKDIYFICAELIPGNVGFIISYPSDNHNRLIISESETKI